MQYRGPNRGTTPPNPGSKSPFNKNIFHNPKDQPSKPSLFPATTVNTGFNPFTNQVQQKSTTPEKKSIFAGIPQPSLFPTTNPSTGSIFRPVTPPNTSTTSLFPNQKITGVNPQQVQAEVTELLQLKKDNELQKQMMEQMLIRIKELEAKNF